MTNKKTTVNGMDDCDGNLIQTQDPRHIEFGKAVQDILNAEEHDQLFIAFSLDIKQFHLGSKYDVAFIVNEAYIRGKASLDKGEELSGGNYRAWLRLTGRNIIRELSRDAKKNDSLSNLKVETTAAKTTADWLNETAVTADHKVMKEVFSQLSQLEQTVLYAKIVDGWRWKEIRKTLINSGYKPMSENYLSQIKRRALKKLKVYFKEAQNTN